MTTAARLLGVHPNTVRAWTDQGRLRCLRINERGDRRYRLADLQTFLRTADAPASPLPPGEDREAAPEPRTSRPRPLRPATAATPVGAVPPRSAPVVLDPDRRDAERLAVAVEVSHLAARAATDAPALAALAATVRSGLGFEVVVIAERTDQGFLVRVVDSSQRRRGGDMQLDGRLVEVCLRDGRPIAAPRARATGGATGRWRAPTPRSTAMEVYVPLRAGDETLGVLVLESVGERSLDRQELDLLQAVGDQIALSLGWERLRERVRAQRAQAQALASVTTDLSSRLELPIVLERLVKHGLELFGTDRAAVYLLRDDGTLEVRLRHNVSERFTSAVAKVPRLSLGRLVLDERRAVAATDYANDPRGAAVRDAVREEGFDTLALTPLMADGDVLGMLALYHDERHDWDPDDLQVLEALGAQAGVAVKNARNYQQMSTWAAQLASIQQLGTRLSRLASADQIGQAIVTELNQLIDYHNVRVYRVDGDDVVPIAWRGEIGEYVGEVAEQLRLRVGEGITGWVAEHGDAVYLPDAARDRRSQTIPGTDDDLDESMLLAPMVFDGRVLGVIVLSRLGLDQFSGEDDLRLLGIYASFAAQALANADATERLRAQSARLARQVEGERTLMRMTESILSTLDPRLVMEEIADRLGALMRVDNLAIHLHDTATGTLRPLFARGIHAEPFLGRQLPDDEGVGGWVLRHGEAQLVADEAADPRVKHFDETGPLPGALIVAPLRGRDGVTGLLTLERLGTDAAFSYDEFELIKLFAGHVSIALQNALAHRAVEIRAQTDSLTSLKNHGAFAESLSLAVTRMVPFSLLVVDLDDFKSFNDQRGHEAGSSLLRAIADAISAACRETDEVFRYGGDEFALILPATDRDRAAVVAAKVVRAVREVAAPGTRRRSGVTCSIGVAGFPVDGFDGRDVLMAADRGCYQAKAHGGDRVVTAAEVALDPVAGAHATTSTVTAMADPALSSTPAA